MNDLYIITGGWGTGKSFLAATYLSPNEIEKAYVHDSEKSMNNIIDELSRLDKKFGRYVDLGERFGDLKDEDILRAINSGNLPWVDQKGRSSLIDYYQFVLNDLDKNLEHGKYKVYIHDTIEKLEAGMAAWVDVNQRSAGVSSRAYGKTWTEGVYPLYQGLLDAVFARGVETVIFTSHLKNVWEGTQVVPGKVEPAGKKLLYRLSKLMIWLVHEPQNHDGAPAGLILKERMGKLEIENGVWKISRRLPQRIPHCTWNDIRGYLNEGCDLANPAEGETPSDYEKEMMSELLSDAQKKLMILEREIQLEQTRSQTTSLIPAATALYSAKNEHVGAFPPPITLQPPTNEQKEAVRELAETKTPMEISAELELPLPTILRILNE